MFNRSSTLAMILIMGLFLLWSNHKAKETHEAQKQKVEQQRLDSLAKVEKTRAADSVQKAAGVWTAPGAAPAPALAPADSAKPGSAAPGTASDSRGGDSAAAAAAIVPSILVVETSRMTVRLDNKGAKVASLSLKELHGKQPFQSELISPDKGGALLLTLNNQDLGKVLWKMEISGGDVRDGLLRVQDAPVTVSFRLASPGGDLVRAYLFHPDSLGFKHTLRTQVAVESYSLKWPSGLNETEAIVTGKGIGLTSNFFSELVLDNGVNVERKAFVGKKTFNAESGTIQWTGLRRKYVAAVMDFGHEHAGKVVAEGKVPEGRDKDYPKEYTLQVSGTDFEEKTLDFSFDVLPLSYDQLKTRGRKYEKIIFSGWEWFFRADVWYVGLCGLVLDLLKKFHEWVPNWGVAIILLTLLVRLVTFPLTIAQTKTGVKMAQHAPFIQKIRERNKGNPQKASAETWEYYRKEGINPMSQVAGCFPMFLQMPIFISLFNVLGRAVELKDAPFIGWIKDLAMPDVVWAGLKVPYLFPLGLTILPFFMAITMFFQMKISIKDPNQKMLVWMMPIMMFVFSCSFPSGLVLYWTVSNIFTIGQTYFYTNKLTKQATANAGTKQGPPSGGKAMPAQGGKSGKPKPAKT